MNKTIAVAVSGGVDSLVSAFLLKRQGQRVFCIHFITGYESRETDQTDKHVQIDRIRKMTDDLDLDLFTVDIQTEFNRLVVDYFMNTYLAGKTPNPCLICNPAIKFGTILSHVKTLGATHLATGHYAISREITKGEYGLFRGIDFRKDQSYFLSRLTQKQLSRAVFPLGGLNKTQTRKIAAENNLEPVTRKESQDICFIKNTTYGEFLVKQKGIFAEPGPIIDKNNRIIGKHKGLHLYTIGQRRGLNCPASQPYYVVKMDIKHNHLVVGFRDDTYSASCRVSDINWINGPPSTPSETEVKIRYRHRAVSATLVPDGDKEAKVFFHVPQMAVTPGQGAVFYRQNQVIGGGWII